MSSNDIVYCELCGTPIRRRDAVRIVLEGAVLLVCPRCASRIRSKKAPSQSNPRMPSTGAKRTVVQQSSRTFSKPSTPRRRGISRRIMESLEVVPDYASRVRNARQRLGWTTRILAEKVGEPESVIKRIEDGRLMPTIDMAMRLEKVLKIKLLQPVVEDEEEISKYTGRVSTELTLGDIANIRVRKKGS